MVSNNSLALETFCRNVWHICMDHRCSVTSWIRTEARNKVVGGVADSFHVMGLAVDIVPDDYNSETVEAIRQDCVRLGVQMIDEGNHLHIEPSG